MTKTIGVIVVEGDYDRETNKAEIKVSIVPLEQLARELACGKRQLLKDDEGMSIMTWTEAARKAVELSSEGG